MADTGPSVIDVKVEKSTSLALNEKLQAQLDYYNQESIIFTTLANTELLGV